MRAPLLAAFLLLTAASARANICDVPTLASPGSNAPKDYRWVMAKDPECAAALALVPHFDRLREAAGFARQGLSFAIDPSTGQGNAYHQGWTVYINRTLLREAKVEAIIMVVAHEVAHAVQDRDGLVAWSQEQLFAYQRRPQPKPAWEESPEYKNYLPRSRQLEAHADSIGQELLLRAGYDSGLFARSRASIWGCTHADKGVAPTTHPEHNLRYVNAALSEGALANKKARAASQSILASLGGQPPAPSAVPPAAGNQKYVPVSKISDYETTGRLRPGRLVAAAIVPSPPPEAGPANPQVIFASMVDYWIGKPLQEAVDRISSERTVAQEIHKACGTTNVQGFAEDYSTTGWIKRVAEDATLRMLGITKTPEPPKAPAKPVKLPLG